MDPDVQAIAIIVMPVAVALIVMGGGVALWWRRNGSNSNHGKEAKILANLLAGREETINTMVANQAVLVETQHRIVDGQTKILERLDRLVEIHLKTEPTIAHLERIMEQRQETGGL